MKFTGKLPNMEGIVIPPRNTSKFDNGHWLFPEQLGGHSGFIYIVRDKVLKRMYLGKKNFLGNGRQNKGKELEWRKYKTSSKLLAELFKVRPKEEFEFIVIEQYKTRGTLSYAETWSLCLVEAPTTKMWYNTLIEKVSWSVKEPISDRHKQRLQMAIDWEDSEKFK